MEGFLIKKIKAVKGRSKANIGILIFCALFFIAIGVLVLVFAIGTSAEDPETASTGFLVSAGGFAVGILLIVISVFKIKRRIANAKNVYSDVSIYGTNLNAAEVVSSFDQQYENGKCTEIRARTEPAEVYVTDTYLAFISNDVHIIDLNAVIWVSIEDSPLNQNGAYNKSGIYGLDFFTKRESGGKKTVMSVILTDGNLAKSLINALGHYPFMVEIDKDLRKMYYDKDYDNFEAECLKRIKNNIS